MFPNLLILQQMSSKTLWRPELAHLESLTSWEKKITFNLFQGKIFTWVSNWLFFCWLFSYSTCASATRTTPSRSLHSIRLTFSISTVHYSPLHIEACCRWFSHVVAREHHMSSEQEHCVRQPVLLLVVVTHLRKILKVLLKQQKQMWSFPVSHSIVWDIMGPVLCYWLDFS